MTTACAKDTRDTTDTTDTTTDTMEWMDTSPSGKYLNIRKQRPKRTSVLKERLTKRKNEYFRRRVQQLKRELSDLESDRKTLKTVHDQDEHFIEQQQQQMIGSRKEHDRLKSDYAALQDKAKSQGDELELIRRDRERLRNENVRYQSAFGNAVSVYLTDADANNLVHFAEQIKHLKHNLKQFALRLTKSVSANKWNALAHKFKLPNGEYDANASLADSIFQQKLIKLVLDTLNQHFQSKIVNTEQAVVQSIEYLCNDFRYFCRRYRVQDHIVRAVHIKARQQVYSALTTYGFQGHYDCTVSSIVNAFFRQIPFVSPSERNRKDARDLVVSCISTLYFSVRSYEPIPQVEWIKPGAPLNDALMEVSAKYTDFCLICAVVTMLYRARAVGQVLTKRKDDPGLDNVDASGTPWLQRFIDIFKQVKVDG